MNADVCHALKDLTRAQLLELGAAPLEAYEHGIGSDVDGDLEVLWALAKLLAPRCAVELGTRQAVSTKTIAMAMAAAECTTRLITVDPDRDCRRWIRDRKIDCAFLPMMGEELFAHPGWARPLARVDFLFIDTDSHSYDQTCGWLDTWVQRIAPGGCAVFHDIVPARPEIQVKDAVLAWLMKQPPELWAWREYPSPAAGAGVGVLWRLT